MKVKGIKIHFYQLTHSTQLCDLVVLTQEHLFKDYLVAHNLLVWIYDLTLYLFLITLIEEEKPHIECLMPIDKIFTIFKWLQSIKIKIKKLEIL